ncbi:MAG TPA: hypothetical protein VH575_21935 [Gemmataceae bacterium]|jgi:hypothetical protein
MLPQALGFTFTRTIPSKVLFGVLTGAYRVYGGVVRNNSGQIMAHLVNGVSPLSLTQPANAVFGAINTYQLHRIGIKIGEKIGVSSFFPQNIKIGVSSFFPQQKIGVSSFFPQIMN